MCYLNSINMDFTIIGLSETWGTSVHIDIVDLEEAAMGWVLRLIDMQNIPGYKHYYCIRAKNRIDGGTSLYAKCSISIIKRSDLEFKKSIFESSVIEIDKHVLHSKHNTIIGVFYRSLNSALSTFNYSLEKLLNVIQKEKKYAYILDDFNVNIISAIY